MNHNFGELKEILVFNQQTFPVLDPLITVPVIWLDRYLVVETHAQIHPTPCQATQSISIIFLLMSQDLSLYSLMVRFLSLIFYFTFRFMRTVMASSPSLPSQNLGSVIPFTS